MVRVINTICIQQLKRECGGIGLWEWSWCKDNCRKLAVLEEHDVLQHGTLMLCVVQHTFVYREASDLLFLGSLSLYDSKESTFTSADPIAPSLPGYGNRNPLSLQVALTSGVRWALSSGGQRQPLHEQPHT